MAISQGDSLPDAVLLRIGNDGLEQVSLGDRLKGRKVVLFAVPGAFTPTCHSAHVPSFTRNVEALKAKGVDEIICISVNDPHVMKAWGQATGATEAGLTLLADADGSFTKAIGMDFDAPAAGLYGRCKRFALMAEDGAIKLLHVETGRGSCEISGGEAMVAAL